MYDETHHCGECDRCLKNVGKDNLIIVPFLYKDMNDSMHKDEGEFDFKDGKKKSNTCSDFRVKNTKKSELDGYRQYYVCKKCMKRGI